MAAPVVNLFPELPRMNADNTDLDLSSLPPGWAQGIPTAFWLDRLFLGESAQMLKLVGLRSSEAFLLQESGPYAPTTAADETPKPSWGKSDFVEVDETKWFDLLKRDRWLSYDVEVTGPGDFGTRKWDMSDDKVWEVVRRPIEIANRILEQALRHEWLASFLDLSARDTRNSSDAMLNGVPHKNADIYRVVPVPLDKRMDSTKARQHLNEYTEKCYFGFHTIRDVKNDGVLGRSLPVPNGAQMRCQLMTLHLGFFRSVFLSKGERANSMIVDIAKIMLHEIMHSISGLLLVQYMKDPNKAAYRELFWDEERWCESGESFEASFFGALPRRSMHAGNLINISYGRPPSEPEYSGAMSFYDNYQFAKPFLRELVGIPAFAVSAMTTRDFWDAYVGKYGHEGLRIPSVSAATEAMYVSRQRCSMTRADIVPRSGNHQAFKPSVDMMARKLEAMRLTLKSARPWYAALYAKWCDTVYSESAMRPDVRKLSLTFGTSMADTLSQLKLAESLCLPFRRNTNLVDAWPKRDKDEERPSLSFYRALGYLALAAAPPLLKKDPVQGGQAAQAGQGEPPSFDGDKLFAGASFKDVDGFTDTVKAHLKSRDKRHRRPQRPPPGHDREVCMNNASAAFGRWKALGTVSRDMEDEFKFLFRSLRTQMEMCPTDADRFHFDFRSPAYDSRDLQTRRPLTHQPKPRADDGVADVPSWAIAYPAVPSVAAPEAKPPIRYFSAAEVGEYQSLSNNRKWIVRSNTQIGELEVFDITELWPAPWTKVIRDQFTVRPHYTLNRQFNPDMKSERVSLAFQKEPIGRVQMPRYDDDILIQDGQEGRPLWMAIGDDVFDVTDVRLLPEDLDLEHAIKTKDSVQVMEEAMELGYHPDMVTQKLQPYKIGCRAPTTDDVGRDDRIFTATEVKWHQFRETGIYTIINDDVYDLTEIYDRHVGGRSIFDAIAGKDGTQEWTNAHCDGLAPEQNDIHTVMENMVIGRIVPERAWNQPLQPHEARCWDLIYDRTLMEAELTKTTESLAVLTAVPAPNRQPADQRKIQQLFGSQNTQRLFLQKLQSFWGTDITLSNKPGKEDALTRLIDNPVFVTAKAVRQANELPSMAAKILAQMNGEETDDSFRESYVSDGQYVYNMTSYIRYSQSPHVNAWKNSAGAIERNPQGVQLLRQEHSHRRIARLAPEGSPEAEHRGLWKLSARSKPRRAVVVAPAPASPPDPIMTFAEALKNHLPETGPPPPNVVAPFASPPSGPGSTPSPPRARGGGRGRRGGRGRGQGRGGGGGRGRPGGRGGRGSFSGPGNSHGQPPPAPVGSPGKRPREEGDQDEDEDDGGGWTVVRGKQRKQQRRY